MTKAQASQIVHEYTGMDVSKVLVHADPQVAGTYAIRAQLTLTSDGDTVERDYLSVGWRPDMLPAVAARELAEVEYRSWPPRSLS